MYKAAEVEEENLPRTAHLNRLVRIKIGRRRAVAPLDQSLPSHMAGEAFISLALNE